MIFDINTHILHPKGLLLLLLQTLMSTVARQKFLKTVHYKLEIRHKAPCVMLLYENNQQQNDRMTVTTPKLFFSPTSMS